MRWTVLLLCTGCPAGAHLDLALALKQTEAVFETASRAAEHSKRRPECHGRCSDDEVCVDSGWGATECRPRQVMPPPEKSSEGHHDWP